MSSSFDKFVFGVFVGVVAGATYAMLTAPRSGEETRGIIRENFKNRVDETATTVKSRVDEVKSRVDDVKTRVQESADELKERASGLAEELETVGRDTVTKLKPQTT